MTCNSDRIFAEIDRRLSKKPSLRLYELEVLLECSHPTIERAIRNATSLSFKAYQREKLLDKIKHLRTNGYSQKKIGLEIGCKWPGNISRFMRKYANGSVQPQ